MIIVYQGLREGFDRRSLLRIPLALGAFLCVLVGTVALAAWASSGALPIPEFAGLGFLLGMWAARRAGRLVPPVDKAKPRLEVGAEQFVYWPDDAQPNVSVSLERSALRIISRDLNTVLLRTRAGDQHRIFGTYVRVSPPGEPGARYGIHHRGEGVELIEARPRARR
jgi:hypothetical protein